jgi:hypothetical protein
MENRNIGFVVEIAHPPLLSSGLKSRRGGVKDDGHTLLITLIQAVVGGILVYCPKYENHPHPWRERDKSSVL